jgi:FlaG/FlaF family flagellin (archaellin)
MKKVLLISIVITLIALMGCVYSPATHVPTAVEQAALDVFANDTSATLDTVECVILEAINAEWKESYVDTATGFFTDTSVVNKLVAAPLVPGATDKMRTLVQGAYLSGYASITLAAAQTIDFYMDVHGSISIWDVAGDLVDYDVYGMSPACAMVFKGSTAAQSVIREHYTYSLDAGTYYIRLKKAENAAYKGRFFFFVIAE